MHGPLTKECVSYWSLGVLQIAGWRCVHTGRRLMGSTTCEKERKRPGRARGRWKGGGLEGGLRMSSVWTWRQKCGQLWQQPDERGEWSQVTLLVVC